jgi:hypothetical protein
VLALRNVFARSDLNETFRNGASDVDVLLGAMSSLEGELLRIALHAVTCASAQAVTSIAARRAEGDSLVLFSDPSLPIRTRLTACVINIVSGEPVPREEGFFGVRQQFFHEFTPPAPQRQSGQQARDGRQPALMPIGGRRRWRLQSHPRTRFPGLPEELEPRPAHPLARQLSFAAIFAFARPALPTPEPAAGLSQRSHGSWF